MKYMNRNFILSFVVLVVLSFISCENDKLVVDILIQNGTIYDGIDDKPKAGSIGILGDKIVFVGAEDEKNIEAKKIIDAEGLIVCAGFIDPHTHADRELKDPKKSHNAPFLMQGVTTVVVGNDGNSYYPTRDFRALYEKHGIGTNAVLMTGHGTLRKMVVGRSDKEATDEDITNMQKIIDNEMNEGSFGLSTGLYYAPGSYSNTEEIIALAKIAAKYDGIYDTHLRDEGAYNIGLVAAIEEAIEIGRQAKLPIHISHIKCLGVDVWGQSATVIDLVERSRTDGIDVTANQYPYDASATGLQSAVVPRWAESGGSDSLFIRFDNPTLKKRILQETKRNIQRRGGPDKLLIVMVSDSAFLGKNLLEISKDLNVSPEAAVFSVLKTGSVRVASFNMTKQDIRNFMEQPWVVTGSDGNTGHPRKYGSFPRKYNKYVKEEKVLDLSTFIKNSSARTAEIYKIPNRGKLAEGYFADVIIFDPLTFKDKADYTDAFQLSEGLMYSIINGKNVRRAWKYYR